MIVRESITLRPVEAADEEFLFRLYASTREAELARVPWSEEEKQAFLKMQFGAQSTFYRQAFPQADYQVLIADGARAGRMYVHYGAEEILLIDIALLPEYRNRGIGTTLLGELMGKAKTRQKPLRIHVEQSNPAMRLYTRLGFVKIDDHGIYDLLQWSAGVK